MHARGWPHGGLKIISPTVSDINVSVPHLFYLDEFCAARDTPACDFDFSNEKPMLGATLRGFSPKRPGQTSSAQATTTFGAVSAAIAALLIVLNLLSTGVSSPAASPLRKATPARGGLGAPGRQSGWAGPWVSGHPRGVLGGGRPANQPQGGLDLILHNKTDVKEFWGIDGRPRDVSGGGTLSGPVGGSRAASWTS